MCPSPDLTPGLGVFFGEVVCLCDGVGVVRGRQRGTGETHCATTRVIGVRLRGDGLARLIVAGVDGADQLADALHALQARPFF
jgi:hypothetical protein